MSAGILYLSNIIIGSKLLSQTYSRVLQLSESSKVDNRLIGGIAARFCVQNSTDTMLWFCLTETGKNIG